MKQFSLLFLVLIGIHTQSAHGQSLSLFAIDTTAYPTIKAKFYAFDGAGKQVRPNVGDMMLTENGQQRTITSVSCPAPVTPKAISSVLVMDVSGSMEEGSGGVPNIDLAKKAAQEWVNGLPLGASEAALTSFDGSNYLNQDFTTDRTKLLNAIGGLAPNGGTNYDAAMIDPQAGGLIVSKRGKYQKVIVFLSDGLPNTEPKTAQIINEAKQQNCLIFCVTLGLPAPQCMKDMALQTGGQYFENVTMVNDIEDIYRKILKNALGSSPCIIEWQSGVNCINSLINGEIKLLQPNLTSSFSYQPPTSSVAALEFSPTFVAFKKVSPGTQKSATVTVTARNSDFFVSNITCSNSAFGITPATFNLLKGQSITLIITFNSPDSGYVFGNFTVTNSICPTVYSASGGYLGKKPTVKTLKLTKPNGGERYVVGSDSIITWEGIPPTDSVRLEYSIDNGAHWKFLTNTASGLQYSWKNIPKPTSNECKVLIKQNTNSSVNESAGTLQFTLEGHTEDVQFVVWSPDGSKVATAGGDDSARIWDAATGSLLYTLDGEYSSITHVSWSPDGTKIVTSSYVTKIWNAATGRLLFTINEISRDVSWSPDGSKIVTASDVNSATIWDVITGVSLHTMVGHTGRISHVSWSPDGSKIVTVSGDTTTKIWNATSGTLICTLPEISDVVNTCWSPDGKKLVTTVFFVKSGPGSWTVDNKPKIWDTDSGVQLTTLVGHEDWVRHVAWSQDGLKVATASGDNTIKIWNPATGVLLLTLLGHSNEVTHVSWSPDCSKLLTGSNDNTARIWDALSGNLLFTLAGHTNSVWFGSWSPDGARVATASEDNTAKIWYVDSATIELQQDESDAHFSIVAPMPTSKNVDMLQCLVGNVKDSLVTAFISNNGIYPFRVDSIHITGTDSYQFSLVSGIPPFTVAAVPHAVEFRFRPTSVGIKTAELLIYTQSDTLTQTIVGEGIAPTLAVVNQLLDFGKVFVDSTKDTLQAVTIKNIGNAPLTITATKHAGPNDIDFTTLKGGGNFILDPDSSARLDLRFAPKDAGRTSGRLLFEYNGVGSPATVQLFAEGIRPDTARTTVVIEDITAQAGEKVHLTLKLNKQSGMQAIGAPTDWFARIHYNNSILFNKLTNNVCVSGSDDSCVLELSGVYNPTSDVLASIPCVVTLGNTDNSIMVIDTFYWKNNTIATETQTQNGNITITGICDQGGVRLFIPVKNSTSLSTRPNPAQNSLQIQYSLREPLTVTLELLDITGQIVQTVVNNQSQVAGQYILTHDLSSLGNGVYAIRLKTNKETLSTRVDVVK
ncbi:MAG: choice-of-anchor D domain-containing protein [Candidatus Kapaibacterium sp.]